MKPSVRLFNPENDIALALDNPYFTPPKNALLLAAAGELLPAWMAAPGDAVLVRDSGECGKRMNEFVNNFNPGIKVVESVREYSSFIPWGWSGYAKNRFEKAGAEDGLPSDETLVKYRNLSHRRTASRLSIILGSKLSFGIPEPALEITSFGQLKDLDYEFFLKLPWSSSGRGVFRSTSIKQSSFREHIEGMIKRHSSVMVERALNPVRDFAMLFDICEGKCSFKGYSLFSNAGTAYSGNILAPDSVLKKVLSEQVPEQHLTELEEKMPEALQEIIGNDYSGSLGVDMMIYRDAESGKNNIAPAIEINLRNTMGFVARSLTEKLLHPEATGRFSVFFGQSANSEAPAFGDGRLTSGEYLPVGQTENFIFKVKVEPIKTD